MASWVETGRRRPHDAGNRQSFPERQGNRRSGFAPPIHGKWIKFSISPVIVSRRYKPTLFGTLSYPVNASRRLSGANARVFTLTLDHSSDSNSCSAETSDKLSQ